MELKRIAGVFGLLLLVACAATVQTVSQQEINQAQSEGRLEPLFGQLETQLARQDISSRSRTQLDAQKQQVGSMLANTRIDAIHAKLSALAAPIPLSVLSEADAMAQPVQRWDAGKYAPLASELRDRRQTTQSAINDRLQLVNSLGVEEAGRKIKALDEVAALSGGTLGEGYLQQKNAFIEDLYNRAVQAMERSQLTEARGFLSPVSEVNPDYKGTRGMMLQINAGLFEKRFWDALGQDSPDEAYHLFLELAETPGFDLVRDQVAPAADDLVKYFLALGDKQRKQGNLGQAFESLRQARYIRNHLGQSGVYSPEEKAFMAQVDSLADRARKSEDNVLAYGYLLVLEMFDPTYPSVRQNLRALRETVLTEAEIKLAAMPMSNSNQGRAYGSGLASKVSQYLMAKIPGDVDIIERAQFDSIISRVKRPDASTYLSYYYVQGDILEAGVDTSQKTGNRQVRVVTEYTDTPNPDYDKWAKMSSSARRDTPEPPRLLRIPHKEDVTIKSTSVKKVGVFSVTFRLVDPFSSKVLLEDSVSEKATQEGESIEGMEIGEFHQEGKTADLPSDSEMLDALADKVSQDIGERLITELQAPEKHYREYGLRASNEDKLQSAAINLGYAAILTEQKGQQPGEVRDEFLSALMRSAR